MAISRGETYGYPGSCYLTWNICGRAEVVKAYYTHEEILTPNHRKTPRAIPSISHNLYSKPPILSHDLTHTLPHQNPTTTTHLPPSPAEIEISRQSTRARVRFLWTGLCDEGGD